jgi:hypothetical protein
MNFSMISSKKRGTMVIQEPWPNAFGVNMPLAKWFTLCGGVSKKSHAFEKLSFTIGYDLSGFLINKIKNVISSIRIDITSALSDIMIW